jgi:Zn-dependent peptidase ImmA (M78 family)/transcriptional regulator with XRE-family HTH domain
VSIAQATFLPMSNAIKPHPPYNPDVFVWARKRRGLELNEVTAKLKLKVGRLEDWETGVSLPTVRQARFLAKLYDRPFLEFFSREVPVLPESTIAPDFRFFSKGPSKSESYAISIILQWANEQRENALDLIEEIGDRPPVFSSNLKFTISDDVDVAASVVREAMAFSIDEQLSMNAAEKIALPNVLREKIENMGILVLKNSGLAKVRVRGVCLFSNPLPVIVFGNEAPSAQVFTLMHEFAHVLLGESAISGVPRFSSSDLRGSRAIEGWCNRFAASFLVPATSLAKYEARPQAPRNSFDLSRLSDLAKAFGVSRQAMLIRLVNLGYVEAGFYWKKMRPMFLAEEAEYQSFGRSPYYGKRYVNSVGLYYTGLVLEAWSTGRITGHNAAEYMGIKNLAHLNDIREGFRV